MTTGLIIVGCGGSGREVFSIVTAINRARGPLWTVEGFADDSPSADDRVRVYALGSRILGPVECVLQTSGISSVVIAIGRPSVRMTVASTIKGFSLHFPPLVHPEATVGSRVTLGRGVVIAPGARLSTNIQLGAHVQIDQNATVGHDTEIGDFSRLNPQACVSGSVQIGSGVLIGANATILPAVSVGSGATVGAQACVVRDVAEHAVVKGVPAR